MKIRVSNLPREQGNLILVALIISAIAGLTLASYLLLAQQQNLSIYRSQTWNSGMAVTEAGIEDGMQLINLYAGSFEPTDLYKWTNAAGGANWEQLSPTTYHTHRTITNGTSSGPLNSYDVWIYNTNNRPAVYAESTVPWTYRSASAGTPFFAEIGSTTASPSITRKVLVKTLYQPLFPVAMAALSTIDLHGNRVATDSFDSSDPNYSTNHFYPFNNPEMTKDNGDICTDAALMDSLNVGNAHVRGHVRTGPGKNTISVQNGSVGDYAWVSSDSAGIQTGYGSTDFNVLFDPVTIPGTPSDWVNIGINHYPADGIVYDYHFSDGGRYKISNLYGSVLVDATNEVVELEIGAGDVSLVGNEVIRIRPGCKLIIYMWGQHFDLTGGAYIDNQSGIADNFYLYGTERCIDITFGGNAYFYGAIYAPQADFSLNGAGSTANNPFNFVGASVTRTVSMNGHYNFHFDENLAKVGPGKGYIPVSWQEL